MAGEDVRGESGFLAPRFVCSLIANDARTGIRLFCGNQPLPVDAWSPALPRVGLGVSLALLAVRYSIYSLVDTNKYWTIR